MSKTELDDYKEDCMTAFDAADPQLYYANIMINTLREDYFSDSEDAFYNDKSRQSRFVYSYREMQAQLFAISELMYNVRLEFDRANGDESGAIKARLEDNSKYDRKFRQSKVKEAENEHK